MADFTVIFGPQGSGKSNTAVSLTRGKKTFRIDFRNESHPIPMGELLHHRPDCVIVDECPLEQVDKIIRLAQGKTIKIQHAVTGLHEIDTPQFYVIISNSYPPNEVFAALGGRGLRLIECERKEVYNG